MKRNELVARLINEGLSEKTLVTMSDKQIVMLSERFLGEQSTTSQSGVENIPATDTAGIQAAKQAKKKFVTYEGEIEETKKKKKKETIYDKALKDLGGEEGVIKYLETGKKPKKTSELKEVDMGLSVKSAPKTAPLFGGKPKTTGVSAGTKPKSGNPIPKKKKSEEESEESLQDVIYKAIKDKLTKDLGRDPEEHEIDEAHEQFVGEWNEEKEPNELKGGQKKIDKNHNGKIDGQDFKILQGQKKKNVDKQIPTKEKGEKVPTPKNIQREQVEMDELDHEEFHSDRFAELHDSLSKNRNVSVAFVKKDGTVRHMLVKRTLSSYVPSEREKTDKQLAIGQNHDVKRVIDVNAYIKDLKANGGNKEEAAKRAWRTINLKDVLGFMVKGNFVDLRDENEIMDRFGEEIYNSLTKSMIGAMVNNEAAVEQEVPDQPQQEPQDDEAEQIREWVDSLVENDYHSVTSKNEIMELIQSKLMEQYPEIAEPDTETEVEPDIDAPPHEAPDEDPFHDPWKNPGEGPDPDPKFEKQGGSLPEFLKFRNVINSMNESNQKVNNISKMILNKIKNK